MIPTLRTSSPADRQRIEDLLRRLRLDPADLALGRGELRAEVEAVQKVLADVAQRGDDALVEMSRRFDDPQFSAAQLRVSAEEMAGAARRVPPEQLAAVRRSIAQVREYQSYVKPKDPPPLRRPGVQLGLRYTPLDSAGLYFPGGKAAYPSTLIMLAVPAQVAGVGRIVVCSPPGRHGRNDLVLATAHELRLTDVFRAGGAAAIAAMAFGTRTVPAVDKIVGPGNRYSQLAKRALAGCVGIDGFLGPSEIVVIADDSGDPRFIASDLIAQAEHDPGSCFLLTDSEKLAGAVVRELEAQARSLSRIDALKRALADWSAIIVGDAMDALVDLANRFAAEHVNVQVRDEAAVMASLKHVGALYVGPYSPVAAGDYVAGPSHCLPTNTTARFSGGIGVDSFMKRTSVVHYGPEGLTNDAPAIIAMAEAEGLDGHAASVRTRAAD